MGAKPVWRCKCGYHLPRHPKRLSNGPECPFCSAGEPYTPRKPVYMVPSYRVAPNPKEIQQ